MRVFRSTYRDRKGRRREARKWYVEFRDHTDHVRRFAAFTDKAATEELGRRVERLVALRSSSATLDVSMARWVEDLPRTIREKLTSWRLLNAAQVAGCRPLEQLLSDFEENLRARDRTEKHVRHLVRRVQEILRACGFINWSDLDALKLERHLCNRREAGLSVKSSNHVLAAAKQFTRWAYENGMATSDPFRHTDPVERPDPRRVRRSLSWDDELPRLIRAAGSDGEYRGMPGPVRALVYRLAAETGLRVSELQSLRVSDFDVGDAQRHSTVTLPATATKNRREACIPLRLETAAELAPYLRSKLPSAPALPLPKSFRDKSTRWLKHDLERAGIAYEDESGRVADFHALRASFVSALVRGGANAKVVQTLARHSDPKMTLGVYAKLGRDDERDALALLPALPSTTTPDEAARATGTDGDSVSASCSAFEGAEPCSSMHRTDTPSPTDDPEKAVVGAGSGGGGGNRTRVPGWAPAERLRV